MSFKYYPYMPDEVKSMKNPAIQLFGNRFFSDQTVSELLVEFLLVVFSPKRLEGSGTIEDKQLIPLEILREQSGKFKYAPKARLNLKLFSFLGASRLDSRHYTHRTQHKRLLDTLRERIHFAELGDNDDVIHTIENLFLGFQGAGSGRTWCAQSFLPVTPAFLARESIWKETEAKRRMVDEWYDLIETHSSFFDSNQHVFLARGGEMLYLQICNALLSSTSDITNWNREKKLGLDNNECNPVWLHGELNDALGNVMNYCPSTLSDLADFIDSGLDPETPEKTDHENGNHRFVSAGWCNSDSWREGYLFAVELLRIMKANLDVVDRIYLLESACAMQVLRSLATQSIRVNNSDTGTEYPGYRLAISAPDDNRPVVRRLSHYTVKKVEKSIFKAIRSNKITLPESESDRKKILKQADRAYGGKLFIGLSKRIGFMVPKRGSGARFILNEHLLRLLVVTTIPTGGRLTFDTFKEILERRHGLVFDADGLSRANEWVGNNRIYLPGNSDSWLLEMLEAAGFLIHLSDACAMVHNPADNKE